MVRSLVLTLIFAAQSAAVAAQTVPAPVPAEEVFTREQIGHALSAPTPEAGHTSSERC